MIRTPREAKAVEFNRNLRILDGIVPVHSAC